MCYVQHCPFKEMVESTEVGQTIHLQKDLTCITLELKICKNRTESIKEKNRAEWWIANS